MVILYNQDPMSGGGIFIQNLNISNGEVVTVFSNLPFGEYAAVVIHDENINQMLDFSRGRPLEGYGTSNRNNPAKMPPIFDECKFQYGPEQSSVLIPLYYN